MTKESYDAVAAAVIALVQSVFPVLILTGALHWTDDTIAAVMLVVTNLVTLFGLVIQPMLRTASSNTIRVNFDATGESAPPVTKAA
jgi:uncharacterized membrane protein YphA (DoxX/SURF4 family)